jgi:hypothetical protein
MAAYPGPTHFIIRPIANSEAQNDTERLPSHGKLVSLMAVDQLPEWMAISGVPRELSVEQTMGMTKLGCVPKSKDEGLYAILTPKEE